MHGNAWQLVVTTIAMYNRKHDELNQVKNMFLEKNKAKAISAELLKLNLKNKLE